MKTPVRRGVAGRNWHSESLGFGEGIGPSKKDDCNLRRRKRSGGFRSSHSALLIPR